MHGHWVHMTVMCIMHNYCPWPCPAGRVTQYIPWWRVGVVYCRARSIYSILLLSCTHKTQPHYQRAVSSGGLSEQLHKLHCPWLVHWAPGPGQKLLSSWCSPRPCQVCWLLASNDSSQHSLIHIHIEQFSQQSRSHKGSPLTVNSTPTLKIHSERVKVLTLKMSIL